MKPIHHNPGKGSDALLRSMLYALQQAEAGPRSPRWGGPPAVPFVTISRQAGAGGRTLGHRLVERLREIDPVDPAGPGGGVPGWSCWDHELVEKVSAEHHIAEALVEALEDARRSWMQEFLAGLSFGGETQDPEEFAVYRRVAAAIRALAAAGRAVIVGRGGVHITAGVPGGVHLRLVAPLPDRVAHMARRLGVTPEEAAARVAEIDRNRTAFYKRYWSHRSMAPETFTVTLNTAGLSESQMADCILPLLPLPSRQVESACAELAESAIH